MAEDRRLFRAAMQAEGLDVPRSFAGGSAVEAAAFAGAGVGYPLVVRPSFTLGGEGGGLAYNVEELRQVVGPRRSTASPVGEVLVEEGIVGWKEFELEVMRDRARPLRRGLLDREHRPDGRAHRRLGHGGAGDDALRRGVPAACATWRGG